jgi:hypothetical protein
MNHRSHGVRSFLEFGPVGFVQALRYLKAHGYAIVPFAEAPARMEAGGRVCILRHDVAVSPQCALRLARIEAEQGVRATYFFHVAGDCYSNLASFTQTALREIVSLGHEIGFGWSAAKMPTELADFERDFRLQVRLLEAAAQTKVCCAAQQDAPADAPCDVSRLIATVADDPRYVRDIPYVSDCDRVFRTPLTMIERSSVAALQLHLHPLYWATEGLSIADSFLRAVALEQAELASSIGREIAAREQSYVDHHDRVLRFERPNLKLAG